MLECFVDGNPLAIIVLCPNLSHHLGEEIANSFGSTYTRDVQGGTGTCKLAIRKPENNNRSLLRLVSYGRMSKHPVSALSLPSGAGPVLGAQSYAPKLVGVVATLVEAKVKEGHVEELGGEAAARGFFEWQVWPTDSSSHSRYGHKHNTWEPAAHLEQCPEILQQFHQRNLDLGMVEVMCSSVCQTAN